MTSEKVSLVSRTSSALVSPTHYQKKKKVSTSREGHQEVGPIKAANGLCEGTSSQVNTLPKAKSQAKDKRK
jgi:hypothetical protein